MKRHIPSPFPRPSPHRCLSHLAMAIAAALCIAPALAGEVRPVAAMQARALAGGRFSMHPVRPATTVDPVPQAGRGMRTLRVTSCADDGGAGTLRSVVASAANDDTVDLRRLPCDRIELSGGVILVPPPIQALTILGPGRGRLAIDAAGRSNVLMHTGSGTLAIRGLSIVNGHTVDDWGGCLSAPIGSIRLSHVRLRSCVAHQATGDRGGIHGGAIFAFDHVWLEDSEVLDSVVSSDLPGSPLDGSGNGIVIHPLAGGAVSTLLGDISLNRSRVTGNRVISTTRGGLGQARGGGLYTASGSIAVTDSVIAGNSVKSGFEDLGDYASFLAGGGLFADSGLLTIAGSTIAGNEAVSTVDLRWQRGGGIGYMGPSARIRHSTIEGNYTTGDGGGLHHQGPSLRLANSTISGNTAARGAGGLEDISPTVLDHVTIAFNRGGTVGGAMFHRGGELHNSIVSDNSTDEGVHADLATENGQSMGGDHNVIGSSGGTVPADTLSIDPMLLPLADNGGPTRTHALDPASRAIDAGEAVPGLRFDQRGAGFRRKSGPASDIGAFEVHRLDADELFDDHFEGDVSPAL